LSRVHYTDLHQLTNAKTRRRCDKVFVLQLKAGFQPHVDTLHAATTFSGLPVAIISVYNGHSGG